MIRFISDLHLDPSRPNITRAFFCFLKNCQKENINALYILGDFFEYWVGDDFIEPWVIEIITNLKNCNLHFPIYFIAGNRDFTLGNSFAKKSKLTILNEPYRLQINNKQILLMHGDLLCTDDTSYLKFRKVIRNPFLLFILKKLPLSTRLKLASSLRNNSSRQMQQKSENIMDATIKGVIRHTQKYNCNLLLIHGHTHRPKIHADLTNNNTLIKRITLGDWGKQAIGLQLNEENFEYKLIDFIQQYDL